MTARIVLVRRGEAAAGWGEDPDPGLSQPGWRQAEAVAAALAPAGPLPVLVSPTRRARETAAPLERAWGVEASVDPATDDDRVLCFRPGNCSQTVVEVHGNRLRLVALGQDAAIGVL